MTNDLQQLITTTLRDPKGAAKQAQVHVLSITQLLQLAVLVCLVGSILTSLQISLYPTDNPPASPLGNFTPFSVAFYGFLSFAILTLGTFLGGKLFGGKGTLPATLFNLTLIQSIMIGIQIINLVAGLILPATIASWIGIAGFAYFIFLFCIFVAELHKFRSPFMVFLGSMGFFLILVLVFGSIVLWLVASV
ncbi:MAG: hypothetical protein F4203_01650 [Rhodobacteraceae bacterium]|nr:hypothetical protein [Paracoccaceae bacterium]MDE2758885.1 hypothetical protein [Paracoccaceae bacterium]MDE2916326.1 hypothetical protein [Paracoccaceae bacterium]MYE37685.1 hypothetical protein [Paracoccaceae bacterium]MYG41838.1 hypothetical protein [Paracoccaceae bacterium]